MVNKSKNENDFFFEQGLKEFESGSFWEAMNSFEKSLKLYPSEFKTHYYRGLSNFFHVTQTKSKGPVSPEWADDYYRDAYQDFNSAIKLNTENKFFPRNDFLYYWCSLTEIKFDKYWKLSAEERFQNINQAINLNPNNGKYLALRGRIHEKLGNLHKANEDLCKAMELDFDEKTIYYYYDFVDAKEAFENFKQKEYEKVKQKRIEEQEKLQQINLETCASLKIRSFAQVKKVLEISEQGFAFIEEKNYQKALEIYEKITRNMKYEDESIEYFSSIFYYRGLCKYHLNHCNDALKDLSFSIKLEDKFNRLNLGDKEESIEKKFDILELQAKVYEKVGDYKSAIQYWTKFKDLIQDPEYYDKEYEKICFNLAKLKIIQGQLSEAFKYMIGVLIFSEDAEYFKIQINLATYLGKQEEYDYLIEKTLKIKNKDEKFLFLQGEILTTKKQFKDAIRIFKKIKKTNANFPFIDQNINRLFLLEKKFSQFKFEDFEKTAIINFKKVDFISDEYGLRSQINHLENIFSQSCGRYFSSKTKLNKFKDKVNWHIKDLQDFFELLENLKKTTRFSNNRTFEELCALMQLIIDKKIDLFIIKNTTESEKYVAQYNEKNNYIIINGDYFYDIDSMCISLTHEIIHYLQKDGIPFGIEIEDSLVELINENYKELSDTEFLHELEAWTYESVPYFVIELAKNRDETISRYKVSRKRLKTIEWITNTRILPIYEYQSRPKKRIKLSY